MIKGLGVSGGIAMGKALVYSNTKLAPTGKLIPAYKTEEEKERVKKAIQSSVAELEKILAGLDEENDEVMSDLIEVQIELTEDPMLHDKINHYIEISVNNAGDAVLRATDDMAAMFMEMENEYYQARAADIKDVGMRIAGHVLGISRVDLSSLDDSYVIFAEDITPSETVTMDKERILGFVTRLGSKTSHTAILAKTLEIPAVVGAEIGTVHTGLQVIVDGNTGEVIVTPKEKEYQLYNQRKQVFKENQNRLKGLKDKHAETKDGKQVELCINIAEPAEAGKISTVGADGVGLFRSEFLYMNAQKLPDEEAQFQAYKTAAIQANGKPVIVRTLDIGGDKNLSYLEIPKEDNPFLGYRAIRICLDNPSLFKSQLRALLRAAVYGDIRIMFPMISSKSELLRARQLLDECRQELKKQEIACGEDIKVGMMVEIPSVAAAAEIYASEIDFFSIGTNDLCQYTLAVDRMNAKIASLYTHFSPGVLRLIAHTIQAAHDAGIPVGMCGEMASDQAAVPLLLGLGLDEFSMSQANVPYVKDRIRNMTMAEAQRITEQVMKMDSSTKIQEYLEEYIS